MSHEVPSDDPDRARRAFVDFLITLRRGCTVSFRLPIFRVRLFLPGLMRSVIVSAIGDFGSAEPAQDSSRHSLQLF